MELVSKKSPLYTMRLFDRYGQGAIFSASLMGDRKLAQDKCDLVMMPGMMYS